MPTPKPSYPTAFRQQIVELLRAGSSISTLAREFGCNASIHASVKGLGNLTLPMSTASTQHCLPRAGNAAGHQAQPRQAGLARPVTTGRYRQKFRACRENASGPR